MGLAELNVDVLSIILSFLESLGGSVPFKKALVPIMKTCKRLRAVAEPYFLAYIILREERHLSSLCDALRDHPERFQHIKKLYVSFPLVTPHDGVPAHLHALMNELLSLTTDLRHFVLERPPSLMQSATFRTTLCNLKHLQSLDLNDVNRWHHNGVAMDVGAFLDGLHAPLRSLRVVTRASNVFQGVFMSHLMNFRDTLQELKMQNVDQRFLDASLPQTAIWPYVRDLHFYDTFAFARDLERVFPAVRKLFIISTSDQRIALFPQANSQHVCTIWSEIECLDADPRSIDWLSLSGPVVNSMIVERIDARGESDFFWEDSELRETETAIREGLRRAQPCAVKLTTNPDGKILQLLAPGSARLRKLDMSIWVMEDIDLTVIEVCFDTLLRDIAMFQTLQDLSIKIRSFWDSEQDLVSEYLNRQMTIPQFAQDLMRAAPKLDVVCFTSELGEWSEYYRRSDILD